MNASKRKGTEHETAIVDYLNGLGLPVDIERRALAGALDKGDIAGIRGVVIEAKAEGTYNLPGWMREAHIERENAGAWLGVVWAKLKGKRNPADCAVIMSGEQFGLLLKVLHKAGVIAGTASPPDDFMRSFKAAGQ